MDFYVKKITRSLYANQTLVKMYKLEPDIFYLDSVVYILKNQQCLTNFIFHSCRKQEVLQFIDYLIVVYASL